MSAAQSLIQLLHPRDERAKPLPTVPQDRDYWLAHCEGYRVESPRGRVGLVECVCPSAGGERPESLVVLAGIHGRRRLIVPLSEVDAIVPHAQRVFLRANSSIVGTESRDACACG